jgi:type IV pilus assembly protein PilQ
MKNRQLKKYKGKPRLVMAVLLAFVTSCGSSGGRKNTEPQLSVKPMGDKYLTQIKPEKKKDGLDLTIRGSGKLKYTIFRLSSPRRLILDLPDMDASAFSAPIEITTGLATAVKAKYFQKTSNSRIEIILSEPVMYKVARVDEREIIVSMTPYDLDYGGRRDIRPDEVEITGIELREMSGLARVVVSYRGEKPKYEVTRKSQNKRITLSIQNAKIRRANEKLLTVTAKGSNVDKVALFQFATKPEGIVKVMADLNDMTSSNVFVRKKEIIFDIGPEALLASASEIKTREKKKRVSDLSAKPEKGPDEYAGKRISLDFQGANIHNILRIIADVSGLNIITTEKVQGKVSMKLKDIPWDLALELILKNNQLGMARTGNIIRIGTLEEIAIEKQALAKNLKIGVEAEKLYLKVFPVNYESVENLRDNLTTIKSPRGSIDINSRTNTLIIQETKTKLAEMEKLIDLLDRRTVQVLIEARIVEVSHSYAQELGIKWGGSANTTASYGFPSTIGLSGVSGGALSSTAGGIVNLGTSGAAAGSLNVRLGHVNSTALLDMQLLALQNKGKGRILSMPKIATMNNIEAIIESGREIPYQTTSAEGTQTMFKRATLSLRVTPHVTQDNYIRLEIDANKDEPDFANQLPNSPPPLLTKKAKTEVLVKNGDTTVIGGLFKENSTNSSASVPFFSDLPLIGWLFRSRSSISEGEELLIFITPRIF